VLVGVPPVVGTPLSDPVGMTVVCVPVEDAVVDEVASPHAAAATQTRRNERGRDIIDRL
jgi:hypothetical protein